MASAPSKAFASLGQPLLKTTASTPGTLSRHFFKRATPALNSCSPGPWLGGPATSTIFFLSSARASVAAARTMVSRSVANFNIFMISRIGGLKWRSRRAAPRLCRLFQFLDANIFKLRHHRRAGMKLQRNDARFGRLVFLLINHVNRRLAIDGLEQMVPLRDDDIVVPIARLDRPLHLLRCS